MDKLTEELLELNLMATHNNAVNLLRMAREMIDGITLDTGEGASMVEQILDGNRSEELKEYGEIVRVCVGDIDDVLDRLETAKRVE